MNIKIPLENRDYYTQSNLIKENSYMSIKIYSARGR